MLCLVILLKTLFFQSDFCFFRTRFSNLLMQSNNPSSNDSYPVFKG